jgi:FkbM family methyltransferase
MNKEKYEWYWKAWRNLGTSGLLRLQYEKRFSTEPKYVLTSKHAIAPVYARRNTSDILVFHELFVDLGYQCVDQLQNVGLILDCGANVGYSASYFLTKFTNCAVIAVEPDQANFAVLEENLKAYQGRFHAVNAAVWPRLEMVSFMSASRGDGNEWGRSVERASNSSAEQIRAVDVPTLIAMSGYQRVSLLKVDIEGAESELFAEGATHWLDRVDNIVIELHGDVCREVFFKAIEGRPYNVGTFGNLTVCLSQPS